MNGNGHYHMCVCVVVVVVVVVVGGGGGYEADGFIIVIIVNYVYKFMWPWYDFFFKSIYEYIGGKDNILITKIGKILVSRTNTTSLFILEAAYSTACDFHDKRM